jgi:hypothetical protein
LGARSFPQRVPERQGAEQVINLFAVPAMALAGSWQVAATLVLAERIGRALRNPTVEAMLSYTTGELGKGWVCALNTALDEIGATLGPLISAVVLLLKGDFWTGYAFLTISAVAALVARVNFPLPSRLCSTLEAAVGFEERSKPATSVAPAMARPVRRSVLTSCSISATSSREQSYCGTSPA